MSYSCSKGLFVASVLHPPGGREATHQDVRFEQLFLAADLEIVSIFILGLYFFICYDNSKKSE